MCIHVHVDNVGRFLETDEFYRNQFETGTSCGALDDGNVIRKALTTSKRMRNPYTSPRNGPFRPEIARVLTRLGRSGAKKWPGVGEGALRRLL